MGKNFYSVIECVQGWNLICLSNPPASIPIECKQRDTLRIISSCGTVLTTFFAPDSQTRDNTTSFKQTPEPFSFTSVERLHTPRYKAPCHEIVQPRDASILTLPSRGGQCYRIPRCWLAKPQARSSHPDHGQTQYYSNKINYEHLPRLCFIREYTN